ncbi:hypothetical protein BDV98DRAFT_589640 [Pterulicium gracile]|uniref:DUF6534 domain-containing protein n=1 Tax=Pterulicium gracile TaxID=1884261 RepID=A0A5C3R2F9_9AGAR|nr:hypothetical protein BDV98DRAFT_589640 [Pterula gracilis]
MSALSPDTPLSDDSAFGINMETILGPAVISSIFAGILFGIATLQTYIYARNFPNDRALLKYMHDELTWFHPVVSPTTRSTLQCVYKVAAQDFGHPERFTSVPKVMRISVFMKAVVFYIVPLFLTYWVRVLSSSRVLVAFLGLLSFARGISSCLLAGTSLATPLISVFSAKYQWLLMLSLVLDVVTDVSLSSVFVFFLRKNQRQSIMSRELNSIMDALVLYTIESGALTALFNSATLIVFVTMPNSGVWVGFLIVMPKVYANCLLASLNGRLYIKHGDEVMTFSRSVSHGLGTQMYDLSPTNFAINGTAQESRSTNATKWRMSDVSSDDWKSPKAERLRALEGVQIEQTRRVRE